MTNFLYFTLIFLNSFRNLYYNSTVMNLENLAVGVDIENIARFEKHACDKGSAFIVRVFTEDEIEYCFKTNLSAKHLAVRYCAKEAVYKALSGLGILQVSYKDIEIYHDKNKVPQVKLLSEKCKNIHCKISLSHSNNEAIAYVIAWKE